MAAHHREYTDLAALDHGRAGPSILTGSTLESGRKRRSLRGEQATVSARAIAVVLHRLPSTSCTESPRPRWVPRRNPSKLVRMAPSCLGSFSAKDAVDLLVRDGALHP